VGLWPTGARLEPTPSGGFLPPSATQKTDSFPAPFCILGGKALSLLNKIIEMDTRIYNLDDPEIIRWSRLTFPEREKRREMLRNGSLPVQPIQPIRINATFAEFKEKFGAIDLEDAYAELSRPLKVLDENPTIEKPCSKTESNLRRKCVQR
jgi:hypothetical protein